MKSRTMRLSQTVAPFGVGAIYDYRGESLIACDTARWGNAGERLELQRLADALGVAGFRSAPALHSRFGSAPPLPFIRFPRWLFCATCRSMFRWRDADEREGEPARCGACPRHPQLVPMRFVLTCRAGHLSDIPWEMWAHLGARSDEQKSCRSRNLAFLARSGAGTGLEALIVYCRTCKSERSLRGITGQVDHLGMRCSGKQPWVYSETPASCDEPPIAVQRGASNLYFADVRSAIDIPPGSDYDVFDDEVALITNTPEFEVLTSSDDEDEDYVDFIIAKLAKRIEVDAELIRAVVAGAVAATEGRPMNRQPTGDLRRDEWHALLDKRPQSERDRFLTRRSTLLQEQDELMEVDRLLKERLDDPVLVTRLREVRALTAFRRYDPGGPRIKPQLDNPAVNWLPAIEVYGEGICVPFPEDQIRRWESRRDVIDRVAPLESRRADSLVGDRVPKASARFVLLHTFAHLLIRRLAFECGYTAASLRERVYSADLRDGGFDPFAGVLIYTAAGDAEGTLGGLVRQGHPPRLAGVVVAMLEEAAWCSSDPICIESGAKGFQGLNLGACHACSLVAETSCEYANSFLDRGLLVGPRGYFTRVLDSALAASGSRRID